MSLGRGKRPQSHPDTVAYARDVGPRKKRRNDVLPPPASSPRSLLDIVLEPYPPTPQMRKGASSKSRVPKKYEIARGPQLEAVACMKTLLDDAIDAVVPLLRAIDATSSMRWDVSPQIVGDPARLPRPTSSERDTEYTVRKSLLAPALAVCNMLNPHDDFHFTSGYGARCVTDYTATGKKENDHIGEVKTEAVLTMEVLDLLLALLILRTGSAGRFVWPNLSTDLKQKLDIMLFQVWAQLVERGMYKAVLTSRTLTIFLIRRDNTFWISRVYRTNGPTDQTVQLHRQSALLAYIAFSRLDVKTVHATLPSLPTGLWTKPVKGAGFIASSITQL